MIANPKINIGDEAEPITNENKCTGFVENSQVMRSRPNPSKSTAKEKVWRQTHKLTKMGRSRPNQKPKLILHLTSMM